MFSLQICRYSVDKLMTEVLKMVKSVKFVKIRVLGKPGPLGFDQKIWQILKICLGLPEWGMVMLDID